MSDKDKAELLELIALQKDELIALREKLAAQTEQLTAQNEQIARISEQVSGHERHQY